MPILETQIRIIYFVSILSVIIFWERLAPRRQLTVSRRDRWLNNLGIVAIDSLLITVLFPAAASGIAIAARNHGWGVFNVFRLPEWFSIVVSVLLLDLVIYLQHVMAHAIPLLWRVHMVHHADLDYDVTTGLRFHPIEIIVSMAIKMIIVAACGMPVLSVLIFEITLNGTAMFNHGNIYLPEKLDRCLRLLVVTPDMHRVHHSVIIRETNSNFGFNFPWWDRVFGTYRPCPAAGHKKMTIGLSQFRHAEQVTLIRLLLLPFVGDAGRYSLKYIGKVPQKKSNRKNGC